MTTTAAHLERAERRLNAITWLLGGIAVTLVLLGLWSVHLTNQQNRALGDIQQSRVDNTFKACQDQNARHDSTIMALDHILAGVPSTQRQRAAASRAPTVFLINALAPHQDCEQQLVTRFGLHHRKPSN